MGVAASCSQEAGKKFDWCGFNVARQHAKTDTSSRHSNAIDQLIGETINRKKTSTEINDQRPKAINDQRPKAINDQRPKAINDQRTNMNEEPTEPNN
jgi:hypothetical protein